MRLSLFALILALAACGETPVAETSVVVASAPAAAQSAIPTDSLYLLNTNLTDQAGVARTLGDTRGHPTLVTMFYASCPAACPMLISDIKAIEAQLEPSVRADLRVVMVSFDPMNDTPAALASVVSEHGLDPARWTLAAASASDARTLSAVLGISYRPLEGGGYNHSAVITLLDEDGRIVAKVEGLRQPATAVLDALGDLAG